MSLLQVIRTEFCIAAVIATVMISHSVIAAQPQASQAAPVPCGVVKAFSGATQLMDSSRTYMADIGKNSVVECGSWISVESGWVQIRHRDGYQINISPGSFVGLPEYNMDGKFSGDAVLLFRGQVFVRAGGGERELKVITPNARIRVVNGSAVVLFSSEHEESQVIATERLAYIENRFEPSKKMTVAEGQASNLNFKLLRVVPSPARAVSLASLKPKLHELGLDEHERSNALDVAKEQQDRKLAALPVLEKKSPPDDSTRVSYERHRSTEVDEKLNTHLTRKLTGEVSAGEEMLSPGLTSHKRGRSKASKVEIEEVSGAGSISSADGSEKKKILNELRNLKEEI
ncbi:MAG: hypothetical protein AABZ06_13060 [Bdellovibrionota bacterium]